MLCIAKIYLERLTDHFHSSFKINTASNATTDPKYVTICSSDFLCCSLWRSDEDVNMWISLPVGKGLVFLDINICTSQYLLRIALLQKCSEVVHAIIQSWVSFQLAIAKYIVEKRENEILQISQKLLWVLLYLG